MRKRITGLVLVFVILVSVISFGVQADTVLTVSSDAVNLLKLEEGFSKTPYWDYAQWTVGYGTKCPDDKLEEYKNNGISEEAAEALLRSYIARFEAEINNFAKKTGLNLKQQQFDALLLFSYNCGTGWMYSTSGVFYQAIVSGATGNTLINAFSRWCNAGGQIKTFLLRRRLCEANIYLNGVYSQKAPENYGYVLYDACGGSVSPNVQGYDTTLTASIIPTPSYPGYQFKGWYTAKTGGVKVSKLDATTRNARLYARWTDGSGNDTQQETEKGITVTVNTDGLNIRTGPGTNYPSVGVANTGDKLVITKTQQGGSFTWGQFSGGWVCLKYTDFDKVSKPETQEPAQVRTGTVKVNDTLRIRSGPSTGYSVVGYLNNGDKIEILEEKTVGVMRWGRISKGWISMSYVVLDTPKPEEEKPQPEPEKPQLEQTVPQPTPPTEEKPAQQIWNGTVKVADTLRIRSGPGTNYKTVGYLRNGEKVTVTEKKTVGSTVWGKIRSGWISLTYVVLDRSEETQKTVSGTVKVSDVLRVRKGAGTSYAVVSYLKNGDKVEILEQKKVGNTTWGRISKGWISLDYVVLNNTTQTIPSATKTVTADTLRIRSAAGTGNKIVGYLYKGAKVTVLETKKIGNTTWGKISNGWISMDYVK